MRSGSNAERSGGTRTRLKRAVASTIPRAVATVTTRAATRDQQSGESCAQRLPTRV
jgi:hypothetical protein